MGDEKKFDEKGQPVDEKGQPIPDKGEEKK